MTDMIFLLIFTAVCCLRDLSAGKIPNSYILAGLLCGIAFRLLSCPDGIGSGLAGFLLPLLLLGPLVLPGMMGGGDVKLLSVIGLFLGFPAVLKATLYSLFIGAFLSILILVRKRNAYQRFLYLMSYLKEAAGRLYVSGKHISGLSGPEETSSTAFLPYRSTGSKDGEFCFSLPIFLGLAVYLIHSDITVFQ